MSDKDVEMIDAVAGDYSEMIGYGRKFKNASFSVRFRSLPGVLYGRLYFTFLRMMDALPYSMRMFLFRKVIARSFAYWKESTNK